MLRDGIVDGKFLSTRVVGSGVREVEIIGER
jgi:hypothetical protein